MPRQSQSCSWLVRVLPEGVRSNLKLKRSAIEDRYRAHIDVAVDAFASSSHRSLCLVMEVP